MNIKGNSRFYYQLICFLMLVMIIYGTRIQSQSQHADKLFRKRQNIFQKISSRFRDPKFIKQRFSSQDKNLLLLNRRSTQNLKFLKFNKASLKNTLQSQISKQKNILTGQQLIIDGWQYNFVIVNQSTVITCTETDYRYLTLVRVNTKDKTKSNKVYHEIGSESQRILLKLVDKDTIAMYVRNNFYIVNINSLQIIQTIELKKNDDTDIWAGSIYFIESYSKNGTDRLFVAGSVSDVKAHVLELNKSTKKYEKINQIYKPRGDFYLNETKGGISFWSQNKAPTLSLREKYKIFEEYQPLKYENYGAVVLSHSQELAASVFESPYTVGHIKISSYLNNNQYEILDKYTIDLPMRLKPNSRKLRFTPNDKFLFVNLKMDYQDFTCVAVVQIQTQKLTYIDFNGQNIDGNICYDYGILDNERFVVVCSSDKKDHQFKVQRSFQLRLYNLSNFMILDTYSLALEADSVELKTNPNFNYTFILQGLIEQNQPKHQVFKIVNNRIQLTNSSTSLANFKIMTQCLTYLIGKFAGENFHSFMSIKNWQVIKKTPIYDVNDRYDIYGPKDYFVINNLLVIGNFKYYFQQCDMYEVYDLSKIEMIGNDWLVCNFYLQMDFKIFYILGKQLKIIQRNWFARISKVFDLQKCQTRSLVSFMQPLADQYIRRTLYKYNQLGGKSNQLCNSAYFLVTPNIIYILDDCEPFKKPTRITLQMESQYSFIADMRMSTSNQYIILIICFIDPQHPFYCQFKYDVRPVNDIEKSVHKTGIIYCFVQKEQHCFADVSSENQLFYLTQDGLYSQKMTIKEELFQAAQ